MSNPRVALQSFGHAGDQPPVVLLHGFASSAAEDWIATGWPAALEAAGRTVHVLDLPGHGDSAAVSGDDTDTAHVLEAITEAVEKAGALEFDVIGYSLGARLAWDLPAASGERVRRMVLGGISPFEPFLGVDMDELRSVVAGQAEAQHPLTGMMAQMISAPGRDTDSLASLIAGLASQPFQPSAAAPTVPTLFVAGEDDMMSSGVDDLVSLVADARLVRVPGDHRGALDSAEFRAAAIEFLA